MTIVNVLWLLELIILSLVFGGPGWLLLFLGSYSASFVIVFLLSRLMWQDKKQALRLSLVIIASLIGILAWVNSFGPINVRINSAVVVSSVSVLLTYLCLLAGHRFASHLKLMWPSHVGVVIGAMVLNLTVLVVLLHRDIGSGGA